MDGNEPIAIVGMGCLFPDATTPEAFWRNLLAGRDSTSQLTAEDLGIEPARLYDARKGARDRTYWLRAGVVREEAFETEGFRIPPGEIAALDEVSRWSLHVAREALRDAGATGDLARCGLVLGALSFPTRTSHHAYAPLYWDTVEGALRDLLDRPDLTLPRPAARSVTAAGAQLDTTPAEAVAQGLGLGGPTFCLDAACASSLYAIALGCAYLRAGRADVMLAGAVSGADPFFITMGFSIFHAFPGDGARSRPLDAASGGLTAGEGAGMVALKRYADARRDGDRIYAVVRGAGLSNDGRGKHVLVPSSRGQTLALERAYAAARLEGRDVQYVECHATGTPAGDVVELNTVAEFYGRSGATPLLGSVKSNFGHLLTAAGAAGTIKVALALGAGTIPPTTGIGEPLTSENGAAGGERIVRRPTAWPDAAREGRAPRRAGVSAFGFGGTNAHLVLEAPTERIEDAGAGSPALTLPALEIVGLGAQTAGAPDVTAYERLLHEGRDVVGELPATRWKGIERVPEVLVAHGAREGAPRGAYLSGFDVDFLRYRIPPNDEDQPIAQQLLLLTTADEAIRDAGLREGAAVGVVVAMETELELHRYRGRVEMEWQVRDALRAAGITLDDGEETALAELAKDAVSHSAQVNRYASFIGNTMATRVAAQWDFNGPAFTITDGPRSAFRAMEVAQLLLAQGDVEAVVVAGVSLAGSPEAVLLRARLGLSAGQAPGDGAAAL
ncbi:MAG TPA: beta-ketoacyl synthase N-terminal-like domain-containing protein, partial [Chloroflexota bacterium]|nr:beta-ketoacyl synthase N-terminal-like domain-containing protein [Chloroflexota bacterium]